MIKIYRPDEVNVEKVLTNDMLWNYPIDELDYLTEIAEGGTGYVLLNGRLYEVFDDYVNKME